MSNAASRTVCVQARLVAEAWDEPGPGVASPEDHMFALEQPMAALALALAGKRVMRLSTDRYDYTRARCSCGWAGGPWDRGRDPGTGKFRDGRELAIHEFARHECFPADPRLPDAYRQAGRQGQA